jgi:predicted transcriptional regulator
MLRALVAKGRVVAIREPRATVYRTAVKRRSMQKAVTRGLLKRFFGGSASQHVLHLLEYNRLSLQQIKKIEKAVGMAQSMRKAKDRTDPRT